MRKLTLVFSAGLLLVSCSRKPPEATSVKKNCLEISSRNGEPQRMTFVPCPAGVEQNDSKGLGQAIEQAYSSVAGGYNRPGNQKMPEMQRQIAAAQVRGNTQIRQMQEQSAQAQARAQALRKGWR